MKSPPKKEKSTRCILIRDSVSSSVVCERLDKARNKRLEEVILRRQNVDAALAGALQDLLVSQDTWEYVELKTSSRLVLRLLKTLTSFSPCKEIRQLVIVQPTDGCIAWLGKNTLHERGLDFLSLQSANLSFGAIKLFSEGLRHKQCSIRRLDLRECSFAENSLEVITELGRGLRDHLRLRELSIRHCHLEDQETANLMGFLLNHPSLQSLDLRNNFCQSHGSEAVSRLLLSSTPLRQLDLSCQEVWDGRSYFSRVTSALSNNACSSLESLDLSSNFLTNKHFEWLLQALVHNRTLRRVALRDNAITNDGIVILCNFLPQLSLTFLDLTNNPFTDVEALDLSSNAHLLEFQLNQPNTHILYHLALNRGGRRFKRPNEIPMSVWPLLLTRSSCCLTLEQMDAGVTPADIVFDLLHGPALLER